MASQPRNSTIQVHRRVRAQRNDLRHESVKSVTDFGRELVMSVPSEEIMRTTTRDATQLVGPTSFVGELGLGLPVVRTNRALKDFGNVAEGLDASTNVVVIGRDKFIEKRTADVADDLHENVRDQAG